MKPQIVAVKFGYNPNSSSIGIWVKVFIYQAFVLSVLFALIRVLLGFKKKNVPGNDEVVGE
jgi:hypothetical protein